MITIVEADVKGKLDEVLAHYTGRKDELIPILQEAQESFRYLPEEVMLEIAKFLRLSESTVYGVATFYAQFKFSPTGRKIVRVCRGTACHVRGGKTVLKLVKQQLGIEEGETTTDYQYSLETVACIGVCALAPNLVVNKETYGHMNPKKVARLFSGKD